MLQNIREFFSPDAYLDNPYGYLTNQIGHGFLGCYVMTMSIGIWYAFSGIYPTQWYFVAAVVFAYLMVWEIGAQGYRGWDSIEDTFYFASGAGLFLFVEMDEVIFRLVVWMSVLTLFLGVGTMHRLNAKAYKKSKKRTPK